MQLILSDLLFLLMAQARLPMPRLPEVDTCDMVNRLNALPITA